MGSFLGTLEKAAKFLSANMDRLADEDLMMRYSEGDVRAFDILYQRHKDGLFRFISRQVGKEFVEELFQDVWSRLIKARSRYHVSAKFRTYLFTIAHRRVIDFYRQHSPISLDSFEDVESLISTDVTPDISAHNAQIFQKLLQVVDQLPAAQREVFALKQEGFTVDEIAEMTATDYETVKSRVRYASNKVKQVLGRDYESNE